MLQIIPNINVTSENDFEKIIEKLPATTELVQIDIADGTSTPKKNWHDREQMLNKIPCTIELHIMSTSPRPIISEWLTDEKVKNIIFHSEGLDQSEIISLAALIRTNGKIPGIAVRPETPPENLTDIISYFDSILILGVHPGTAGQTFLPETIEKISLTKKLYPNKLIEADGGISLNNVREINIAGADYACAASAIFSTTDPSEALRQLISTSQI